MKRPGSGATTRTKRLKPLEASAVAAQLTSQASVLSGDSVCNCPSMSFQANDS